MAAFALDDGVMVTKDTCKVKDPVTDYEFDLIPLRSAQDYTVADKDGRFFKLNVCGKLIGKRY